MRSANAPVMSAGVMMANIIWYAMKRIWGIVWASGAGSTPTPASPRWAKPPTIPPMSGPNASVYPKNTHWRLMTAIRTKLWASRLRTFLDLTSPP